MYPNMNNVMQQMYSGQYDVQQTPVGGQIGNNGVYWIGQDGNVWVSGGAGTNAAGAADANSDAYWTGRGFRRIDDPNSGGGATNNRLTGPTDTTTGKTLNQAAISNTQLAIDQIPGLIQAALDAENQKYNNVLSDYSLQEQNQRGTYDKSSVTNQQNYDANMMDSVRGGVRGMANLMNLLRGTGVEGQARDIVGGQTAQDIRTGLDTRNENQTQLDTTMGNFLTELKRKREMANDTRVNNERATRRDSNTQLQDLFGKMAGYYSEAGNAPEATNWMNRAGDLTPSIAADSKLQVSAYDKNPIQVKAPEISAFAAPKEQAIGYTENGKLGSGIFTLGEQRRRKEAALAGY